MQKTATAEATVKKRHAYVHMTRKTAIGIRTLFCQRLVVGALREKKFDFQKGGSNGSKCSDLPKSNIVKNTFLKKKTLKNFHSDGF